MSRIPFESFLTEFTELKSKVKSNPQNLLWRARNDPHLGRLACQLEFTCHDISLALASSPEKITVPPTGEFGSCFREYRTRWASVVEQASREWLDANSPKLMVKLDELRQEIGSVRRDDYAPSDFDPTTDDPCELIDVIFWLAKTMKDNEPESDLGEELHKGLQAWDYLKNTLGIEVDHFYRRWKQAQHVFIPPHVAREYGSTEAASLYALLNEAHRAFVFGVHGAALAMCRAVMETVLTRHYGATATDLEKIIMLAENKHVWMRKLSLQSRRVMANKVLHDYKQTDEAAILEFLDALRELIEKAPHASS